MKIIQPSVTKIDEKDVVKKIELAARTCYKSEDKITEGSALKMFKGLVKSHHTAMLEHAAIVFSVPRGVYEKARQCRFLYATETVVCEEIKRWLVSGNIRAINESGIAELIGCLRRDGPYDGILAYADCTNEDGLTTFIVDVDTIPDLSAEESSLHRYTTMRFVTNRAVTHEIVRHRLFGFAQESQRYVQYQLEKFGNGDIQFIEPAGFADWNMDKKQCFESAMRDAEKYYNDMIRFGSTAQEARAVLPNATKTEIVVTGNDAEWQHFFDLRSRGTTGAPDSNMKLVADMALELYK